MRKRHLLIGACALALCVPPGLAGCSGKADKPTEAGASAPAESTETVETTEAAWDGKGDFVWFKAEIPGGFELHPYNGDSCREAWFKADDDRKIAPSFQSHTTAQKELEGSLKIFDDHKVGEDVQFAGHTWKMELFEWNDKPSVTFYTDVEGGAVEVTGFELAPDDPDLLTFMNSLEFPDDVGAAAEAAWDTLSADVRYR
ncbi:hypothetical protein ABYF34_03135 [Buchananella felis]|uniref:hypothetical protein n=1 Tax=Buchananella felis TaxID=3231492 RepID=UPI00352928EA